MNHVDLFSGIGGFALAAQWAWGENHNIISFCEIDKFCQKVLHKHWPKVPCHEDIKTLNAEKWRGTVDLVTGGFPCQPYSLAGKRAGAADDRALWPEMRRIIEECWPRWIVAENVPGIITMEQPTYSLEMEDYDAAISAALQSTADLWTEIGGRVRLVMGDIAEELEEYGYDLRALDIPACAVDASHIRSRVWILAHSMCARRPERWAESRNGQVAGSGGNVADTHKPRSQRRISGELQKRSGKQPIRPGGSYVPNAAQQSERKQNNEIDAITFERNTRTESRGDCKNIPNTNGKQMGRPTIARREYCEWSVEPELGRVANGISDRVDRLKSLGNAIVPQVAFQLFNFIKQIEEQS